MNTALIAEVGLAHDGSEWLAHAYVDAVAGIATHVKFQAHSPRESSHLETWRTPPPTGESRSEYWARTSFTKEQWARLSRHAHEKGLDFCLSVFHDSLVDELARFCDYLKVPSGAMRHEPLLSAVGNTGLPVYYADGLHRIERKGWTRLVCTSKYPTPIAESGLNEIRPGIDGLSDHTAEPLTAALAVYAGAVAVEVHVTFDWRTGLPDALSSLSIDQLAEARRLMNMAHLAKHGSRPEPDSQMQRKYGYKLRGPHWSKPAV